MKPEASKRQSVELVLFGRFLVRSEDGADLTPKSRKACGIIALLAKAPEMRRSRRWIADHLWSDRHPDQAGGSLRQSLVDIKRSLGDLSYAIGADRRDIWLEAEFVRIADQADAPAGAEFLEGLDIRDPAFEDWRAACQPVDVMAAESALALSAPPTLTLDSPLSPLRRDNAPIVIRYRSKSPQGLNAMLIGEMISNQIGNGIGEHVSVLKYAPPLEGGREPEKKTDIEVECDIIEDDGVCLALIKVLHAPSSEVLYSKTCRISGPASSLIGSRAIAQISFDAAEATLAHLPHSLGLGRPASRANALGQLALHKLFSFDPDTFDEAELLFNEAHTTDKKGVFLAWSALLQLARTIEMPQADRAPLQQYAQELINRALASEGTNAVVRSLVAQTDAMLWGDPTTALPLATGAVEANPDSPYALQALASAKMLEGAQDEAYNLSARARAFAAHSRFRQWWDLHHCNICVATGRLDEAIATGEAAVRAAPALRPVHRHLIALYAHRGNLEAADQVRQKLVAIEPGFTLDQMINDPEYPVRTLRKTGLITNVKRIK